MSPPADQPKRRSADRGPATYDLVLVGSGPASAFFLVEYLRHAPPTARVLVLERGLRRDRSWLLQHKTRQLDAGADAFVNTTPRTKDWRFSIGLGGSSNCWVGCTPRMLPEDFELKSRYGVGADWPLTYAELEPFYLQAEQIMAISGPDNTALFPRSGPYPQPPHRMHAPDEVLAKAWPGQYFAMPTARARQATERRAACCTNHKCQLCPVDAKFTVVNELMPLFDADPRVEVRTGARVEAVDVAGDVAKAVRYTHEGREVVVKAELVGLGANAMFNPVLLERSGLAGPEVGRGLVEQAAVKVDVMLDGLDSFQGSTYLTGHGYMLYGGEHRAQMAAGLIETKNKPDLRMERGKWRQRLQLTVIFEDLRLADNRVVPNDDPKRPAKARWRRRSEYTMKAVRSLEPRLAKVLAPLPIERMSVDRAPRKTESHVMGTTVMGHDPATSVVDAGLVHHRVRNLVVLGASTFPTAAPANPTLTLSALSLRAASKLAGA